MAAGLSPENWALLALCGAALGLASSLVAIEPGFLFMPLLAILLPRFGAAGGATAPIAIATALTLLVPVSIAGLRPLSLNARRRLRHGFRRPSWRRDFSGRALRLIFQGPGSSPASRSQR